eukprot:Awhi_evm1s8216
MMLTERKFYEVQKKDKYQHADDLWRSLAQSRVSLCNRYDELHQTFDIMNQSHTFYLDRLSTLKDMDILSFDFFWNHSIRIFELFDILSFDFLWNHSIRIFELFDELQTLQSHLCPDKNMAADSKDYSQTFDQMVLERQDLIENITILLLRDGVLKDDLGKLLRACHDLDEIITDVVCRIKKESLFDNDNDSLELQPFNPLCRISIASSIQEIEMVDEKLQTGLSNLEESVRSMSEVQFETNQASIISAGPTFQLKKMTGKIKEGATGPDIAVPIFFAGLNPSHTFCLPYDGDGDEDDRELHQVDDNRDANVFHDNDVCEKNCFSDSLRAEEDFQSCLLDEMDQLNHLFDSCQLTCLGGRETWTDVKETINSLLKVVTFMIDYQSFVREDFQTQYDNLKKFTKIKHCREELLEEISMNEKWLVNCKKKGYKEATIVTQQTLSELRLQLTEIDESRNDSINIETQTNLATFVSCRTMLLNNVKKFTPERLLDKELLRNIGMKVMSNSEVTEKDSEFYLQKCSLLGVYFGTLDEDQVLGDTTGSALMRNGVSSDLLLKKVYIIEKGHFGDAYTGNGKLQITDNSISSNTNNDKFVLKQYLLSNVEDDAEVERKKRRFYRQCFLLKDLRHPNIITVRAIFEGMKEGKLNSLCLVMPFFKHGDLSQWMEKHPPHTRLLSFIYPIIIGILHGLDHLHQNDIIHSDIKPGNIFLNGIQPIIGDFDEAREIHAGLTQTIPYATFRYLAPEIQQAIQKGDLLRVCFDEKTDMYAFGVLVEELLKDVQLLPASTTFEDYLDTEPDGEYIEEYALFIHSLKATPASSRPSAAEALLHNFLDLYVDNNHNKVRFCELCCDSYLDHQGLWCCAENSGNAERHFICKFCVNPFMESLLEVGYDKRIHNAHGRIHCWNASCTSPPVHPVKSGYIKFWNTEVFLAYQDMIKRHAEENIRQEEERKYQERLKLDMEKSLVELTVLKHLQHIQNELLTLKCPLNGHAFVDFTGCAALKCKSCDCHFCAYCLIDCKNSTSCHNHVTECSKRLLLTQDRSRDAYYSTANGIEIVNQALKSDKVHTYWNDIIRTISDMEIRQQLYHELNKELLDVLDDVRLAPTWKWFKELKDKL